MPLNLDPTPSVIPSFGPAWIKWLSGIWQNFKNLISTVIGYGAYLIAGARIGYKPEDFGAVGDGVTDDDSAIQAWIAHGLAGNPLFLPPKTYLFTTSIVIDDFVQISGCGENSVLMKNADVIGIEITTIAAPQLYDFTVDNASGSDSKSGIKGTQTGRCRLRGLLVQNQGGHGIEWVSGNLTTFADIKTLFNDGDGIYLNGASTPDVNGCVFTNIDTRGNGGIGINLNNAWANFFYGVTSQNNTGVGMRLNNARQNYVVGYVESNGTADLQLVNTADCKGNYLCLLNNGTVDNSSPSLNVIFSMKRGSVFDPNFSRLVADQFEIQSINQAGTAITGNATLTHPSNLLYTLTAAGSSSAQTLRLINSGGSNGFHIETDGHLGVGNCAANTNTPSGATAYAMPIYNATGTLLGYIPVYASQW